MYKLSAVAEHSTTERKREGGDVDDHFMSLTDTLIELYPNISSEYDHQNVSDECLQSVGAKS